MVKHSTPSDQKRGGTYSPQPPYLADTAATYWFGAWNLWGVLGLGYYRLAPIVESDGLEMIIAASSTESRWDQMRTIANIFADIVSDIPLVEKIWIAPVQRGFLIRTIVDSIDEPTAYAIYERELVLVDKFPDIRFNFQVLERRGNKLQEIASPRSEDLVLPCLGHRHELGTHT